MTNAEARFNKSLRPRKPEGSLGRTAQDVHFAQLLDYEAGMESRGGIEPRSLRLPNRLTLGRWATKPVHSQSTSVQCCFTSTETVRTIRSPAHLDCHTTPELCHVCHLSSAVLSLKPEDVGSLTCLHRFTTLIYAADPCSFVLLLSSSSCCCCCCL